jgi:large subunit ribosomal protein L30
LLPETAETFKLLTHVRNFIAYGPVDQATLTELIAKRGQVVKGKKIDPAKVAAEVEKKSLEELGLKPFFRLHPPRGGIKSKLHYPLKGGVLGDNKKDINTLVRRML